ncbi:MAG: hypothetical protein ONB13_07850 [candidate division KSB1 bacterium]|nr:hypothetical protein [candidate division KSB1 bacterium]MDZ7335245.1 hypothetical protein [candidate division KSB1 bacterium]MDZ7358005.1 hypothetical protein [candidate division KSB1 bacterium]MDZ7376520.1 hypothetical protein [candidate division KSB1 bacterium]MDZ7399782.1 hypothetical protein [candidate division KSB1 bacterium]
MYRYETQKVKFMKIRWYSNLIILLIVLLTITSGSWAALADSVKIIAKHPEIRNSSIYQVNFVLDKAIPAQAAFRIVFPIGFDLSDLMIAGSSTINGGFVLQVEGQTVTIKRSGLGKEIPPNQPVDVKFAIVKNPPQPADDYEIHVELLDESEKPILKTTTKHKIVPEKQ